MWGEFGCYVYERKCEQDRNCLLRSMAQALFPIPSLQRKPFSSEFRFPERHNFVNIEWHALFALNTSSLVHHTRRLNRQVEPRQTLLSSITVFSDSIHIGSMSPSSTIHLGLSLWISERSRIVVEKRPAKNRWVHSTGSHHQHHAVVNNSAASCTKRFLLWFFEQEICESPDSRNHT